MKQRASLGFAVLVAVAWAGGAASATPTPSTEPAPSVAPGPSATPFPSIGPVPSATPVTSEACDAIAAAYRGTTAAAYVSTVGAIRALPIVAGNPRLDGYADEQTATVCYIDGEIAKSPPPPPEGTTPPSFDRAVVVIVGDEAFIVTAGYRESLLIQAP